MNPILLQKQLKENSNDLQDFFKDLQSWGEEMKRKEDSLKNNEGNSKKTKTEAPEKSKHQIKEISGSKLPKSGGTDYAKWDKYDADLECERLEDDIKDDSELTDEFEDSARDEALVHKEKGNSYVRKKEWDKAIEAYTKALKCYSYDPVFYANRALCHLKKQNFTAAEEDCTLSLKLDGTYVKALQRRAAARESVGKLELAKMDLENVLKYEPKNKESLASLENLKKKIGPVEKVVEDEQRPVSKFTASRNKTQFSKPVIPSTTPKTEVIKKTIQDKPKIDSSSPSTSNWPLSDCEIIPVRPIDKPPHLRSKKPLKRIEITEVDNIFEADTKTLIEEDHIPIKKHVVENVKKVTFQDENVNDLIEIASTFRKKAGQNINEHNEKLSKEENNAVKKHVVKKVTFQENNEGMNEPIDVTSTFKKKREQIENKNKEKLSKEENIAVKKHVTENVKKVTFQGDNEIMNEPIEIISTFKKKREQMKNEHNEKLNKVENTAVKNQVDNVLKIAIQSHNEAINEPVAITSSFGKKGEQIKHEHSDILSKEARPKSDIQNDIRTDDLKIFEKTENTVKNVKNNENLTIAKMDNKTTNTKIVTSTVEDNISEFLAPKTSVQFYTTWRILKTPSNKYKYLKLIDPDEIARLFQESLESNVFSGILDILSTQFVENGDDVYPFLNGLTQVKRFSALTMFMDSTDKNCLWKIVTYLREQERLPKEDIDKLILKYEL